ncbi:hypothetical protein B0H19DRAFT_1250708 [Mycena capillaripes]|nr:hypothetical protein B0H19DRAFT_1250708 [Mycena capillaripes]
MPRGRKSKFNAEQLEWLNDEYSAFEDAQRRNKPGRFWVKMEATYFKKWPEEEVLGIAPVAPDDGSADAEPGMSTEDATRLGKERKKQLHAWFNNHNQKVKKGQDNVGSTAGSLAARLFKAIVKKRRRLQEVEIFQKRNKKAIDDAVKAAKQKMAKKAKKRSGNASDSDEDDSSNSDKDNSSSSSDSDSEDSDAESSSSSSDDEHSGSDDQHNTSGPRPSKKSSSTAKTERIGRAKAMRLRRKVAQKLWKKATPEEREIVAKIYREQQPYATDGVLEKPLAERTPEEIQAAIDELPGIVAEFHAGVHLMTGWLGSGDKCLTVFLLPPSSYCSGESPGGLTLENSLPDWENVVRGAGQWLKRCNSRDVRRSRALVSKSPASDDPSPEPPQATPTPPSKKTKVGKNGLAQKPTKREMKAAAKAAKAARAVVTAAVASPPAAPVAATATSWDDPLRNNTLLVLDPVADTVVDAPNRDYDFDDLAWDNGTGLSGNDSGAGMAPSWLSDGDGDVPIDPALLATAATSNVDDTPPTNETLVPDPHMSPIVQAFGALAPTAAIPSSSYQALNSSLATFVYPPPIPLSITSPSQSSSPLVSSLRKGQTPAFSASQPSPSSIPFSQPNPFAPATPSPLRHSSMSTAGPPSTPKLTALLSRLGQSSPSEPTATVVKPQPPAVTPSASQSSPAPQQRPTPRPLHGSSATTPPRYRCRPDSPPHVSSTSGTTSRPSSSPTPAPLPSPTPASLPSRTPATASTAAPPAASSTPAAASTTNVPSSNGLEDDGLAFDAYPESRPMCNAPLPPKAPARGGAPASGASRGGRGGGSRVARSGHGGAAWGRRGGAARGGRGGGARTGVTEGFTWMQTYDDDGNTVPLPLDTLLPGPSRQEVGEIWEREKVRDNAAKAAELEAERRRKALFNVAGDHDLVIVPPLHPRKKPSEDVSVELPEGSKRVRKPAASREMPLPISFKRPKPGEADARAAKEDDDLVKRLKASNPTKAATGTRKRKAVDENVEPSKKKRKA